MSQKSISKKSFFATVKKFSRIIVSGPQRSGTTFCCRVLAESLGYRAFFEESFNTYDEDLFYELLRTKRKCVVQAPAMSYLLHKIEQDDETLIIFMRRDLADILLSQERVGWNKTKKLGKNVSVSEEWVEKAKYASVVKENETIDFSNPIAQIKYAFWDIIQKPQITNKIDVDYIALEKYFKDEWVASAERKHFHPRQSSQEISNDPVFSEFYHEHINHFAQLFLDVGEGFNEQDSVRFAQTSGSISLKYDLSSFDTISELRFDPLNDSTILRDFSIKLVYESERIEVPMWAHNGEMKQNGEVLFQTIDPCVFIPIDASERLKRIEIFGSLANQVEVLKELLNIQKTNNEDLKRLLEKDKDVLRVFEKLNEVRNGFNSRISQIESENGGFQETIKFISNKNSELSAQLINSNEELVKLRETCAKLKLEIEKNSIIHDKDIEKIKTLQESLKEKVATLKSEHKKELDQSRSLYKEKAALDSKDFSRIAEALKSTHVENLSFIRKEHSEKVEMLQKSLSEKNLELKEAQESLKQKNIEYNKVQTLQKLLKERNLETVEIQKMLKQKTLELDALKVKLEVALEKQKLFLSENVELKRELSDKSKNEIEHVKSSLKAEEMYRVAQEQIDKKRKEKDKIVDELKEANLKLEDVIAQTAQLREFQAEYEEEVFELSELNSRLTENISELSDEVEKYSEVKRELNGLMTLLR